MNRLSSGSSMRALRARRSCAVFALLVAAAAPAADLPAPAGAASSDSPRLLPRFESVLDDFRHYRVDEPATDWRAANETAARLGGHGGQLDAASPGPAHDAVPHPAEPAR